MRELAGELAQGCSVAVRSLDTVRLANGDLFTMRPEYFDTTANELAAVSTVTITLTNRSGQWRIHEPHEAIGVVRGRSGGYVIIPTPMPNRIVKYPRVTHAGPSGWHVLFATTGPERSPAASPDTASLWYGHFDGAGWSNVTHIASLRDPRLQADFASRLLLNGSTLSFAFPFASTDARKGASSSGIAMVQRVGGSWRVDTLSADAPIGAVQIAADKGRVAVFYTRPYKSRGETYANALLRSDYTGKWSAPHLFAGMKGSSIVGQSSVIAIDSVHRFVSWFMANPGSIESGVLQWAIDSTPSTEPARVVDALQDRSVWPFEVALVGKHALWTAHSGGTTSGIRTVIRGLGVAGGADTVLDLPMNVSAATVIPTSPTSVLLVTSRLAASPTEPPVTTIVARLDVSCPDTR